ncbi:MAG: hypothetical protein WDO68_22555 [Gammaproteobacteria bacterium]
MELPCLDYINGLVPRRLGGFAIPNPQKRLGLDEYLFGLDRLLPGLDIVHAGEQTFYCSYQIAQRKKRYGYKLICLQAEVNPFWAEGNGRALERAAFVRANADLFIARSQRARSAPALRRRRGRAHPRYRPRYRHAKVHAGNALTATEPAIRDLARTIS